MSEQREFVGFAAVMHDGNGSFIDGDTVREREATARKEGELVARATGWKLVRIARVKVAVAEISPVSFQA